MSGEDLRSAMSGKHPNEEMLQRFVFEPSACPPEVILHLTECPECCIAAAGYLQLGKALRHQPAPEFSFDLAATVMSRLASQPGRGVDIGGSREGAAVRSGGSRDGAAVRSGESLQLSRLVVPVVIAIVAVLPAWLFRKTAYLVFSDMPGAVAGVILALAGVAVLFSCYKYYRRYQQIIQLINK